MISWKGRVAKMGENRKIISIPSVLNNEVDTNKEYRISLNEIKENQKNDYNKH